MNKNATMEALMRMMGSVAFVAAARGAYAVAKDPQDESRRLFLPLKNNIGNDRTGLAFRIEPTTLRSPSGAIETSRILWEPGAVTVTADEAMAPQGNAEERGATEEAQDWLRDLLSQGPSKARDAQKEARDAGISEKSLRTAREKLGIKPRKRGFAGGWWWSLDGSRNAEDAQGAEDAQRQTVGILADQRHLGAKIGNGEAPRLDLLSTAEEMSLRNWMNSIGETDADLIQRTLDDCQKDASARQYFLGQANATKGHV
jgi:hypothetical protein